MPFGIVFGRFYLIALKWLFFINYHLYFTILNSVRIVHFKYIKDITEELITEIRCINVNKPNILIIRSSSSRIILLFNHCYYYWHLNNESHYKLLETGTFSKYNLYKYVHIHMINL